MRFRFHGRGGRSRQSGAAVVAALLLLAFMTVVGGAFLSTSRVDVAISDNYRAHASLGSLAAAGIEEARVRLGPVAADMTALLGDYAGPDGIPGTSPDLGTRLGSDDLPVLPEDPAARVAGAVLPGSWPGVRGRFHVFLQNDAGDGADQPVDTNGVVTLVSFARIGDRRRRLEADLARGAPMPLAALTLSGAPEPAGSDLGGAIRIDGGDRCGGPAVHAGGVFGEEARLELLGMIPAGSESGWTGAGLPPDVENVGETLPGVLGTPGGMEDLVRRLARVATRRPERPPAGPVRVGDVGTPEAPELVFVDGDARLGPGTGFGVLIVTGDAVVEDGLVWNGLVLIAGTGRLLWAGRGDIHGALWLAGDRGVVLALGGDGSIRYDSCALDRAYRALPLSPIAFRER